MIHWLIVFINICCFAYTGNCFLSFERCILFLVIGLFEFGFEACAITSLIEYRKTK